MKETYLRQAKYIKEKIIAHRHYLHKNAECGFELPKTIEYIEAELKKLGYIPHKIGKGSVYATVNKEKGNGTLLRADIDALPLFEESGEPFASNTGFMHACGHDMHCAMLLGAAELLASSHLKFNQSVTLLFQGGEELLQGAKDTIDNRLIESLNIKRAFTIHVIPGLALESGTLLLPKPGIAAPAADYFECKIKGLSAHGSTPWLGKDALICACKIITSFGDITTKETPINSGAVISVGSMHSGKAGNVISDSAFFEGTVRSTKDEMQTKIKKRISEYTDSIANLHGVSAELSFKGGAPTLIIDKSLVNYAEEALICEFGKSRVIVTDDEKKDGSLGGSEDFAHFSHKIPSVLIGIAAGSSDEGFKYPLHHPMVRFDDAALPYGAAALVALGSVNERTPF